MIRPTTDLVLPSGYTAKIVTYWTFDERTEIAAFAKDSGSLTPEVMKGAEPNIDIVAALKFQMTMVRLGTLGLVSPEGVVEDRAEVSALPSEDIDYLFEHGVNKVAVAKKNS